MWGKELEEEEMTAFCTLYSGMKIASYFLNPTKKSPIILRLLSPAFPPHET